MSRGDGINRTNVRNMRLTATKIQNTQQHNEREKMAYVNQDIVSERTSLNVHFKEPDRPYTEIFDKMVADKIISTRGLKDDAFTFGELVFDVNSAYFYNNGGYEFAKKFYGDAYRAAIEIVGGEQYILSAVMHADERNRAMSEVLGKDVYHYHLHVVYIPIVEKQILWTKRCKDKALVGTVKETIHQVSMSKKWDSRPAVNENGQQILTTNGKPVLKKSYSVLQDNFYEAMRKFGYSDIERGEAGSSEEHLTVTQFKVEKEQERLAELTEQTEEKQNLAELLDKKIGRIQRQKVDLCTIENVDIKPIPFSSKVSIEKADFENISTAAKKYLVHERKESKLQKALDLANNMITELKRTVAELTAELAEYRSIKGRLSYAKLQSENEELRGKVGRYEEVLRKNGLSASVRKNKDIMEKQEQW